MDKVDAASINSEGQECPPVPIKTYQWEDVKRSRLRGGYPWTHIQKGAYDQTVDPDIFTMDYFRRNKSTSTLGSRSSGVMIEEIIESDNEKSNDDETKDAKYDVKDETTDASMNDDSATEETRVKEDADDGDDLNRPGTSANDDRTQRARSEEPKRKRKLSIESSYSRISMKSLSQLGIVKRLKEAKDKIKMPKFRSFPKLDKKGKREKAKTEEAEVKETKKDKPHPPKDEKPVYIYIPLKLPPGETDEFSHYADEERLTSATPAAGIASETPDGQTTTDEEKSVTDGAATTGKQGVQFIILTAPSDDEILDDASIPDTPSEKDKQLDKDSIDALKCLAKNVVDQENKNGLQSIKEERSSEEKEKEEAAKMIVEEPKTSAPAIEKETKQAEIKAGEEPKTGDQAKSSEELAKSAEVENRKEETVETPKDELEATAKGDKVLIDEEDGLKLSEKAIELINEELAKENLPKLSADELKASLKAQEEPSKGSPPSIKKKVSFKRKNKPNDDYEVIEVSKSDDKTLEASQSMSVDEEKSYLDDKIIKMTSLEEDYNKWSKNPDHEYEPVNPPPEEFKITQQSPAIEAQKPVATVSILKDSKKSKTSNADATIASSGEETDNNEDMQHMQDRLEATYFNKPITEAKTTPQSATNNDPDKDDGKNFMEKIEGQGKRIKDAFNVQTGKFKTRIKGMKKPNVSMPQKPRFDKIKMQRIKDSMPKMPDTSKLKLPKIPEKAKINLPSFTLPKKGTATSKLKQRQFSTESNAGDSKMKIFDFSTYPRIFKGKKKDRDLEDALESATMPRTKDSKTKEAPKTDSPVYIRIPLHSEESMEQMESADSNPNKASHTRYNQDIELDDAYLKENQEIHKASPFSSKFIERWKHGTFHAKKTTPEPETEPTQEEQKQQSVREQKVTDLDNSDEQNQSQSSNEPRLVGSGSLGDIHGRGVIEQINEDEFFVRQKGISQDNIEVGEYLSSEIREAFMNPVNPLRQMQDESYDREYELDVSDQSLEEVPKKRSIKKPKRKRTPHVSQEKIAYDRESITTEPEEYPKEYPAPGRPKRRSKKGPKKPEVVPYQETIPVERPADFPSNEALQQAQYHPEKKAEDDMRMYENGHMEGIEQPEILVSNPYQQEYRNDSESFFDDDNLMPFIPPRKHRSLKSLSASEHDSIIGEYNRDLTAEEMQAYRMEHEYIIPTPELEPPVRPNRSRTRSQSQIASNVDDDSMKYIEEESNASEIVEPCIEPACTRDLRDSMGYAIIDKNRQHEPPLPPPRFLDAPKTPPRRRRGKLRDPQTKFSTVPRQLNDTPPARPLRNYSTLGSMNGRKKLSLQNLTDEEKENVDLSQYSEIPDDDSGRHLQSGEVVQKMKDRPLPAPPRPPRKPRGTRTLRDITNEEIVSNVEKEIVEEAEMSTQTEPLPDDFVCEERYDSHNREDSFDNQETITHGSLVVQPLDRVQIVPESQLSRERIIPIVREHFYENEISEIPEDFLNLTSPEEPSKQAKPKEEAREKSGQLNQTEVETLKAQKLQVNDLDVDRLTVNELLANKIRVSDIDSGTIQVSEINSQGGNLVVNGIELPQSFIQELVGKLQNASDLQQQQEQQRAPSQLPSQDVGPEAQRQQDHREPKKVKDGEQKKTPIELSDTPQEENLPERNVRADADIPERPRRTKHEQFEADDKDLQLETGEIQESDQLIFTHEFTQERRIPLSESQRLAHEDASGRIVEIPLDGTQMRLESASRIRDSESHTENENLPPPRPPQPRFNEDDFFYMPSQPPPSFYTLRSPILPADFLDDDIPLPPRRRRHHKQHAKDNSTSSEENLPVQKRTSRRSKTPEASIPELAGQLTVACANEANRQFKRLITYITNNVLDNADGKQDLHVTIVLLLVLIAGLILLGFGDGKTVHYHHWEYFNPPKNL